jgi:hypothetical protein
LKGARYRRKGEGKQRRRSEGVKRREGEGYQLINSSTNLKSI